VCVLRTCVNTHYRKRNIRYLHTAILEVWITEAELCTTPNTHGGNRSETMHAYVTSKKIIDLRKSIALFGLEFYKNSSAPPVSFLQLIYNSRFAFAFALYKYQGRGCTIAKTKKKKSHFHNLHIPPYSTPFHFFYFVIAHRYYRHLCKADSLNVMAWVHYKTSQFRQLCVLFLISNKGGISCWHFSISTYGTTPREWAYFCPEPRKMPTCETYSIDSCYCLPA